MPLKKSGEETRQWEWVRAIKIRVLAEVIDGRELLCPYVVCEDCDEVIRSDEEGIVVRDLMRGDVQDRAFHNMAGCQMPWRPLREWLAQVMENSVGRLS